MAAGCGGCGVSWDAYLTDDRGHSEGQWNYTHNCNRMIAAALLAADATETPMTTGPLGPAIGPAWWDHLDGMTGEESKPFLAKIIAELRAHPEAYRPMNPENGWGSYDSLLEVLQEMHAAIPEWPCRWEVSG